MHGLEWKFGYLRILIFDFVQNPSLAGFSQKTQTSTISRTPTRSKWFIVDFRLHSHFITVLSPFINEISRYTYRGYVRVCQHFYCRSLISSTTLRTLSVWFESSSRTTSALWWTENEVQGKDSIRRPLVPATYDPFMFRSFVWNPKHFCQFRVKLCLPVTCGITARKGQQLRHTA
jgi:hypothetical protein